MNKPRKRTKVVKNTDRHPKAGIPVNDDLTPCEVAEALESFSTVFHPIRAELKMYLDLLPSLSGCALDDLTRRCMELEGFLAIELAPIVVEIRNLHERALGHLMHHYSAVDPASLIELMRMVPQETVPSPMLLSKAKYRHYDAIAVITGEFLRSLDC